jgi:uncharacterized protein YbjQ (UPF0145 family)
MIVTTTGGVQGHDIDAYLGVVTGEALVAANIVRDVVAGIRDRVGARIVSGAYERERPGPYAVEFQRARETAMRELERVAAARGASAVVGVWLDCRTVGGGSMVMVTASGTAVRLKAAA